MGNDMGVVLITGANRGIGLEFCRQYARDNWTVIACCRQPTKAVHLQELAKTADVQLEALDVADFVQIDALSGKLAGITIDVLINNAGVYADRKESGFGQLDYRSWTDALQINTLAPVKMAEAFLPQIQRSDKKLIVNISSLMGSIADNTSGGSISYRSSKAALNAAMKSLALDLAGRAVGVLTLHPGWVKTDMGGANALISASESVSGMRRQIEAFHLAQSGSFVRYDGAAMPW